MPKKLGDLAHRRFDRLVVQKFAGTINRHLCWECVCDCGNIKIARGSSLISGDTKSCGCMQKEGSKPTHGHTSNGLVTRTYKSWQSMMQRCYNSKHHRYEDYGGRGIKVCERWHKFENFLEDMGERPEGKSLDREDNYGGYAPDNCRWASGIDQQNNTRRTLWYEYEGSRRTLPQWARYLCMSNPTLYTRLTRGWSIERAFTTPVKVR